jgi:hypothetical protein
MLMAASSLSLCMKVTPFICDIRLAMYSGNSFWGVIG